MSNVLSSIRLHAYVFERARSRRRTNQMVHPAARAATSAADANASGDSPAAEDGLSTIDGGSPCRNALRMLVVIRWIRGSTRSGTLESSSAQDQSSVPAAKTM